MSEGEPTPKVPFKESPDTKSWSADTEVPIPKCRQKKLNFDNEEKNFDPEKTREKNFDPNF